MSVLRLMVVGLAISICGSARAVAAPAPDEVGEPASAAPGNTLPLAPAPPSDHRTALRAALFGSLVVTASASVFALYSRNQAVQESLYIFGQSPLTVADCGRSDDDLLSSSGTYNIMAFRKACGWHTREVVGLAIAGAGALTAVVAAILLLNEPERRVAAVPGPRRTVAIAPVVTPSGGGASLSLSW